MSGTSGIGRAGAALARNASTAAEAPPPRTPGVALAMGSVVVAVSDALALPWGHRPDWSSPAWWAWQAAVAAVVGLSLCALAYGDGGRRPPRARATARGAWRLHRLAGRLTHEVSDDGMRPDGTVRDPGDDGESVRTALAAQLASPVTTRDALAGEGPEALRLAYVILVLCRSSKFDLARAVALSTQSDGVARGMGTARELVAQAEDEWHFMSFFLGFYLDHHAYWETAILQAARQVDGGFDPMLVNHLARTHRAVWLAVTGRAGEPYFECAGIEAHAREETRRERRLAEPHVDDAVGRRSCR